MRIAVVTKHFERVFGHPGRARRFLVFEAEPGAEPVAVERLELAKEDILHEYHGRSDPHPVEAMDVLITASCGDGFVHRMARSGVKVVTTEETDPLTAVRAFLADAA
ncbi:MAG: nitrogen fixation protein [Rhodobacterales bacterium]|nr:nitrogen fixation protein [Rhodobacterales bacterium]